MTCVKLRCHSLTYVDFLMNRKKLSAIYFLNDLNHRIMEKYKSMDTIKTWLYSETRQ